MMLLATNHNYWFGQPTAGVAVFLEAASINRIYDS